jgi:hypothetical protein
MVSWPNPPAGVIPVTKYSDRNGAYITLTQDLRQTALEAGDYLHFEYDDELNLIRASAVEPPENYHPNTDPERKIQDNLGGKADESLRMTLRRRLLKYDLGIDIADYPTDDPYVLQFIVDPELPVAERTFFALTPLGHLSDVFRNPNRHEVASPIPDEVTDQYATRFDLTPRDIRSFLGDVAVWVDESTVAALNIEPVAEPTLITHEGQEVAVEYLPQDSIGRIARLFDASTAHTTALYRLHDTLARDLLAATDESVPEEHPFVAGGPVEALVVPQAESIRGGLAGEGRVAIPPVAPGVVTRTAGLLPVAEDELTGALSALTDALEPVDGGVGVNDTCVADRVRDPVVVPAPGGYDVSPAYPDVRIEFVESGAGADVARTVLAGEGVAAEDGLATGVQQAYNQQAEQLLRAADVAAEVLRFRRGADAVLVPVRDT